MKRILPPIFMLMVVVVIAFATPIDAQKEQQQVEPITTTLHTEKAFEANLAAEPKAAAVDDGLLTSPSGLDAEDLHLRHNLIGTVTTATGNLTSIIRLLTRGSGQKMSHQALRKSMSALSKPSSVSAT